ncbi:MAG: c-type cytochrome [Edaphobacter sp.]
MAAATTIFLISGLGCRQDMHDEPKFFPQRGTDFYADGRSVRPQMANTVARNQLHADTYFYTGFINGKEGDALPFPVTMKVLERGQERYNIYCTPCHSRVGNGAGMIVQRGYAQAANLQAPRFRAATLGHFFNVMTNGYGSMPDYAAQMAPVDRWAVAAYIRALELSQNAQRSDVPAGVEVKPLKAIAESEGLPESFTAPWGTADSIIIPAAAIPLAQPGSTAEPPPDPAPAQASPATTAPVGAAATVPTAKVYTVAQVQAGQNIYAKNCAVCHTAQLTGRPPTFPSLVNIVSRIGEAHVRHDIRVGASPMPAFTSLSAAELNDLVAYLTTPSRAGHSATPSK